jgi:hypothetical protein
MDIIQKAMGFVAYPPHLRQNLKSYVLMTSEERWFSLALQFEKESLALYGLADTALVTHALQTGISVLKTVFCDKQQEESFMG